MAQVDTMSMPPHMLSWGALQLPEVTISDAPPVPIRSPLRSRALQSLQVQPLQIQPLQVHAEVDSHPWIRDSQTISRRTSFDGDRAASPADSASIYSQDDQTTEIGSPATLTDSTQYSDDSSSGPSTPRLEFQSDVHFFHQHYDNESCTCEACDKMSKSRESSIGVIYLAPPVLKEAPTRKSRSFLSRNDSSDGNSVISAIPSRSSSIRAFSRRRKPQQEPQLPPQPQVEQIMQRLNNLDITKFDISHFDSDEIPSHPAVRPLSFAGRNRHLARADSRTTRTSTSSDGTSISNNSRSRSIMPRPSTVLSMRAPSFTSTIATRKTRAPSIIEDYEDDAAEPPTIGLTRPIKSQKSDKKKFSFKYKLGDVMNVLYAGY